MADDHLTEAQLVTQLVAQTEVLLDGIKELLEAIVPGLVATAIHANVHPSNRRDATHAGVGSVTENLSSEGELAMLDESSESETEGGGQ